MKKIIQTLKQNNRLKIVTMLIFASTLSVALVCYRIQQTKNLVFIFLIWNLILATIPYVIGLYLYTKRNQQSSILQWSILFFIWLIFLPNAPYILTDLIHLKVRGNFPLILDLIMLLFYAWIGLMMCLYSIKDIQQIILIKYGKKWSTVFTYIIPFVCAFGVYVGRFLRYDSWQLISNFDTVMVDILKHIVFPQEHINAIAFTLLLGTFILFAFKSIDLKRLD